jgi:hydroxymethylglutaryl-CoA reductase (NADPH)
MDLRNLPEQLSSLQRVNQRRTIIERELKTDLKHLEPREGTIGDAEKKNCEQMFGVVPIPVGYAGPLKVSFSNNQQAEIHLPLATTEGALAASVNRGCKAVSVNGVSILKSVDHGITRSIAFRAASATRVQELVDTIRKRENEWKAAGHATSSHLKITKYDIDLMKQYVFLTIAADTDAAMGMNMVTIASQAIADWMVKNCDGVKCITVAGNVDSDKKPSKRTHERGRGQEVVVSAMLSPATITDVLKTTADDMVAVANAKLKAGSELAGAIGKNLHAANIIAALYLSTGQDAAHVTEGSLADTDVEKTTDGLKVTVRLPAIIVGTLGGGTSLPAQTQCREMLLKNKTGLPAKKQLAESIAAAVLAGEVSLLAAQASQDLAKAHGQLAR